MKHLLAAMFMISVMASCNSGDDKKADDKKAPMISAGAFDYNADTVSMKGYIAYDSASSDKRPVVMIVHEWWGLTEYARSRARQLADMGYLAVAVDMYGNGTTAESPELAGKLAVPFYTNPAMAKQRFDAALAKVAAMPQADTARIAAIGYCFGGAQVLNMARLGSPLKGVVSFHGNLVGVPPDKSVLKADVLICHGESDQFVPATEVAEYKKQMDSIGAPYTFKSYPNATHAFTNPEATAKGQKYNLPIAYNAAADSASWNDMKVFLKKVFGE